MPTLETIDAVLPLTLRDYGRFEILQKSCNRFFKDLGTCWIVTPDQEWEKLSALIQDERYRVVPETQIVPEFKVFRFIPGWFKQQLIKLAIAKWIDTPFYLTLDADVICVKPIDYSDLVKDNRAVCYVIPEDPWPEWYDWAEYVLDLKLKRRQILHNVTPAVISRDAMLKLQNYLTHLYSQVHLSWDKKDVLLSLLRLGAKLVPPKTALHEFLGGWRTYLAIRLPWTEYALYYSFLEATNQFDQYHVEVDHCIYSVEYSVWYKDKLSDWNPAQVFDPTHPYSFIVFQSNLNVSPDQVWESIRSYIE
jgi:hypothetical protein